ncbi:MAG: patatin-like phospholipase family protein [Bacteroidaceae bacterium]|nr:patatin-like phospholipase family protein [Bacteroidaceae bacterium]
MRRFLFSIVTALFLLAVTSTAQPAGRQTGRKRVAVVLSGGGAKGVAHIGVLKVLERAGIPVDIVTGTSMGSIVGGLYAVGYTATELDSIVRNQDWTFLLSDREDLSLARIEEREKQNTYFLWRGLSLRKKRDIADGGFIKGKNIDDLFDKLTAGYGDSIDFNHLPIPFACVATDIVDNSEHDFHSGRLAQAMRASMAIPGVFAPVRLGDKVLVDGGLRNNYPADLAREMGADIIIGVSVQGEPRTADDLGSAASILGQIVDVNCKNKYDDNLAISDLVFRVNTKGYSSASFSPTAIDTLIRRGEEEAMAHWDEILALRTRIGTIAERHAMTRPARPGLPQGRVKLERVEFVNMTASDEAYLRSKFGLREGDSINVSQADLVTTTMRMDLFYKDATSRVVPTSEGNARMVFTAGSKKTVQAGLGIRFDTEEMAALQLNADIPMRTRIPTDLDLTLRLGKRSMLRANLFLHPRRINRLNLSLAARRCEVDVYAKGDKDYNLTYYHYTAELAPFYINVRNLSLSAGLRWDHFHYSDVLVDHHVNNVDERVTNDHYFNYFVRATYNSENNWYFPSRGAKFRGEYCFRTDDFAHLGDRNGLSDVSASWRMNFPLSSRFTLQGAAYGRLLFGGGLPTLYNNVVGGEWHSHYIEQQMPFPGTGHIERAQPHFVALQLKGQQRMGTNNYLIVRAALAAESPDFSGLLHHGTIFGTEVSYYYNTPFGPLGATVGYSTKTRKPNVFINLGYVF